MCDFKDAKVGDRVWSVRFGWGEVVALHTGVPYPIQARFVNFTHRYSYNGVYIDDGLPTLFWDEVKIIPPPKPKKFTVIKKRGFIDKKFLPLFLEHIEKQPTDEVRCYFEYEAEG